MADHRLKDPNRGQLRSALGAAFLLLHLGLDWLVRTDISYLLRFVVVQLPMFVAIYLVVGGILTVTNRDTMKPWLPWAVASIYAAVMCGAELAFRLGVFNHAIPSR
jgi:hypothetical protein